MMVITSLWLVLDRGSNEKSIKKTAVGATAGAPDERVAKKGVLPIGCGT